jgi:xanthine/uracil permease
MTRFKLSPVFRKHLPDLVAGLTVFAIMVGLTGWHVGIAMASDGTLGAELDRNASAVLLAGAVAAIAVFNTAFFRHLARVHAAPRRAAARQAEQSGRIPPT